MSALGWLLIASVSLAYINARATLVTPAEIGCEFHPMSWRHESKRDGNRREVEYDETL